MVYQNTIPFGAPSQRRLHMAVNPEGTAYLAVLDPYNLPQGNLHHMTVPFSEVVALSEKGEGEVTATSANARITISTGHDQAHRDLEISCEDVLGNISTTTTITRSDFAELVQFVGAPSPSA